MFENIGQSSEKVMDVATGPLSPQLPNPYHVLVFQLIWSHVLILQPGLQNKAATTLMDTVMFNFLKIELEVTIKAIEKNQWSHQQLAILPPH